VTILAGISAARQSSAPINLAAQIARTTGENLVAAAVVERPWPPRGDPVEDEYLRYVTSEAEVILSRVVGQLPGDLDIATVVHQSSSIPTGLIELAGLNGASMVVLGSSSSGLLGRVALGSVTERLVHTAEVPVVIAPRGYGQPGRVRRLTAAYGGDADINGLIPAVAELAKEWSTALRIVSFTVRPLRLFAGTVDRSAEDLVVDQWAGRIQDDIAKQLNAAREHIAVPDVDVVVGSGHDWRTAVENVPWADGDILVLGSGAAAQTSQVFLGSAASKILRDSPVPAIIVPRRQMP
jgi:nucleotide-binding universal stress UspA family protein